MRKVTRMYDNSAILVLPQEVDTLKAQVMDFETEYPEFTEIFDRKYDELEDQSLNDMMEKCAILTHIFHRDF